jgi:hypothetical protein
MLQVVATGGRGGCSCVLLNVVRFTELTFNKENGRNYLVVYYLCTLGAGIHIRQQLVTTQRGFMD